MSQPDLEKLAQQCQAGELKPCTELAEKIRTLTDQDLALVARTSRVALARIYAVAKLSDRAALAEIAKTDLDPHVRNAATERLSDQVTLANQKAPAEVAASGNRDQTARTLYFGGQSGFGMLIEVKKPEETIQHGADLTPKPEYKGTTGELTHGVVVRRIDDKTIELGVGTTLQVALQVDSVTGVPKVAKGTSALGYPGSLVTLQPGTSVIWQNQEVSPEGSGAVTFRVVADEKTGQLTLSVTNGQGIKYTQRRE